MKVVMWTVTCLWVREEEDLQGGRTPGETSQGPADHWTGCLFKRSCYKFPRASSHLIYWALWESPTNFYNGCHDPPLRGMSSGGAKHGQLSLSCMCCTSEAQREMQCVQHTKDHLIAAKGTCSTWPQKSRSCVRPACKEIPQTNKHVNALPGPNVPLPPNVPCYFI